MTNIRKTVMGLMGSTLAPAPIDYRVERCMKNFKFPIEKVQEMWKLFCKFDRDGKGTLNADDFFVDIIKVKRNGLTDAMFGLIDCKSNVYINFGEFVELICTFCCFEQVELLRYLFYILDQSKTGLVELNEFRHFMLGLWDNVVLSNFNMAMDYIKELDNGDGVLNFKEVTTLQAKYPNVFYPLYNLQTHVMTYTLSVRWWEKHKAELNDEKTQKKAEEMVNLKKRQKAAAKASENVNEAMVQKRMGIRYYLMFWRRGFERNRMAKIAAIESELEKQTKLRIG